MNIKNLDLSRQLVNFKGIPLKDGEEPVTLVYLATISLLRDVQNLPTLEKVLRYNLAKKIVGLDGALNKVEVDRLKSCIGETFTPLVVGLAYDLIDEAPNAEQPHAEESA